MSFNGIDVLSVVCARAGSKGLKNKCAAKINNRMLSEYAIEYSLSLGDGIQTVVSTDIEEVIEFCKSRGITYIRRAPSLCTDESRITDALVDAIEKMGGGCRYCSLVYANIPTRYPHLFIEALHFLGMHRDYDAVLSMQKVGKFHPEWMFDYNEEVLPEKNTGNYRRQMLLPKMIHDGHTLIFKANEFYRRYKDSLGQKQTSLYSVFGDKIKPMLNSEIIIDIDTENDFRLASAYLSPAAVY